MQLRWMRKGVVEKGVIVSDRSSDRVRKRNLKEEGREIKRDVTGMLVGEGSGGVRRCNEGVGINSKGSGERDVIEVGRRTRWVQESRGKLGPDWCSRHVPRRSFTFPQMLSRARSVRRRGRGGRGGGEGGSGKGKGAKRRRGGGL